MRIVRGNKLAYTILCRELVVVAGLVCLNGVVTVIGFNGKGESGHARCISSGGSECKAPVGFAAQCEWIVSGKGLVNATAGLTIFVARKQHMLVCS